MSDTPEAPASATVRVSLDGFEWLFTLRAFGSETKAPANLIDRMGWVNEKFLSIGAKPIFGKNAQPAQPAQAPVAEPEEKPEMKPCPKHPGKMLKLRRNDEGGEWYSHKVGDEWCRGE